MRTQCNSKPLEFEGSHACSRRRRLVAKKLRLLPSTGITRLLQLSLSATLPAQPFPVCVSPPTFVPPSPSFVEGCPRRSLPPPSSAFPISQVGRPPHCPFRGLLRSLALACSLNRLMRPFDTRVLTNRSDSCWTGFAPVRRRRLSMAH